MTATADRPSPIRSGTAQRRSPCWPTGEQALLLRAAILDGAAAIEAWTAWQSTVDIETIDSGSFRLLPLLQRNLMRMGVTSPLAERLRGVHRQSWFRNSVLFGRAANVVRALEDAGIPTLLLKGIPLALRYYGDPSMRPMADADILVRTADADAAADRLQRLGWRSQHPLRRWPPPHRASWAFCNDAGHELDLHWHVFANCLGTHDDDALWDASIPLSVNGVATRALGPADQLLHVLAHGIHWNPLPSIRWVADSAAIIMSSSDSLDWNRLLRQAATRRLMPVVAAGVPYVHQLLNVPVPDAVLDQLRVFRPSPTEGLWLWARTNGGALPGAYRMWTGYRDSLNGEGVGNPIGFTRYLCESWLVDRPWELPAVVREKIARAWVGDP